MAKAKMYFCFSTRHIFRRQVPRCMAKTEIYTKLSTTPNYAETLKKCPHKWLLTYDDSPFVRELFPFANIESWNLMYGMRNQTATSNQKGNELFISNYELHTFKEKQLALAFSK